MNFCLPPLQLSRKRAWHGVYSFHTPESDDQGGLLPPVCSLSGLHAKALEVIRMESLGSLLHVGPLRPRLSNFPVDVDFK